MAISKSAKIEAEIEKVKAKIAEQQARLKELEQKKHEAENSEIVDIVRGMSISLTELPLLFEKLKDGGTLGQSVPKLACSVMPPLPTKSCDFAGAPSSEVAALCVFYLRLVAIAPSLILRENRKIRGAVFDGSPDNT